MITCAACTHAYRPDADVMPDLIRAQRLLLAMLTNTGDAAALVAAELTCFACRGRILSLFLTMTTSLTVLVTGSQENAIKSVQEGLLSDLDGQRA